VIGYGQSRLRKDGPWLGIITVVKTGPSWSVPHVEHASGGDS
jgi:hypothetical protein